MKKGRRFVKERTAKFTYLIVDNDYFLACCGWRSLSDDLSYYYTQHEITSFFNGDEFISCEVSELFLIVGSQHEKQRISTFKRLGFALIYRAFNGCAS